VNATTKQIEALRHFKVPESQIRALSVEQASQLLTELISRARTNPKGKVQKLGSDPLNHVSGNLNAAANIVMEYFELEDKGQLREEHIALIQECSRQIYGLKYWLGKTSIND